MGINKMSQAIDVYSSQADSRSLIMPHQKDAVDALSKYFRVEASLQNRSGLLVMPTGSGKTFTAVHWLLTEGVANGYVVIWLVHRQELVQQTYNEFVRQSPTLKGSVDNLRILPVSNVHMGMSQACDANIYVCCIASVANKFGYRFVDRMVGEEGKKKLIVVVDEAHHAVAANYQKALDRFTFLNPRRILLGLTATPKRMQESEQKVLQKLFNVNNNLLNNKGYNGYVYETTLQQLLIAGYLATPIYERVETEINGEIEFETTAKDEAYFKKFNDLSEELKKKIAASTARNKIIVDRYLKNREKYGKTLIFALNQAHAELLSELFKSEGVECDYAISNREDAQEVIKNFKDNKFKVLVNVEMLTEGSDVPDVQTVFLTRQTNSDALLMQMIGRSLRGEKVGGTKEAYIVAFHDTWTKFAHWLDPGALDIFEEEPEEKEAEVVEQPVPVSPDEAMLEILQQLGNTPEQLAEQSANIVENHPLDPIANQLNDRDLYLKLYEMMRLSLWVDNDNPIFPCGWYSVIDDDGQEQKMLVFDSQLEAYENIKRNLRYIVGQENAAELLDQYLDPCDVKPDEQDLKYFLSYIEDNHAMPPYFDFTMRDAFDPKKIAAKLNSTYGENEDDKKIGWLEKLYDQSPVLQQIYRYFFAFRISVFDAMNTINQPVIVTIDEREEYKIVDNYYDLNELLNEVRKMFPLLRTDMLTTLAWSKTIVRDWWGMCQRFYTHGNLGFEIYINRLLSSPKVDREVIKYLIFHELLHANGYWNHNDDFHAREWQYPNSAKYDSILDTLALDYKIDELRKGAAAGAPVALPETKTTTTEPTAQETTPTAVAPSSDGQRGIQEGFKYCRNCGNKLPSTANFCDRCGERMNY